MSPVLPLPLALARGAGGQRGSGETTDGRSGAGSRMRSQAGWLLAALLTAPVPVTSVLAQEQRGVASAWPSPLAESMALARRLRSPIEAALIADPAVPERDTGGEHRVDLPNEAFDLYVPARRPADGFGVLVFLPPAPSWPVPPDWREALDRAGLIYVAPRAAGNDQSVVGRRIPLLLHALALIEARFPVDPQERYVSGFSGGGRVAMWAAVAFPDQFSGALLFAGSDEIGTRGVVLPARPLAERLIHESRFVFVTGARDLPNRRHDTRAQRSLESACVANIARINVPGLGHDIPPGASLQAGLAALMRAPSPADPECLRLRDLSINEELDAIEARLRTGQASTAAERLRVLDARFGGLAAPRSVELAGGETSSSPGARPEPGSPLR